MYTYIIKSGDLHKIGKTKDVTKRVDSFKCGNPYIEHVKTIEGNYESYLHTVYKSKRVKREWFNLTSDDLEAIDSLIAKEEANRKEPEESEKLKELVCDVAAGKPSNIPYIPSMLDVAVDTYAQYAQQLEEARKFGELISEDIITISLGQPGKESVRHRYMVWDDDARLVMSQVCFDKIIAEISDTIRTRVIIKKFED